jgi:hypothetical protein
MKANRGFLLLFLFGLFGGTVSRAQETIQEAIPNWPAPATWSPHGMSRGVSTMAAISPFPFIGVTPCRQYDSRNFTPLPDNTPRSVTLILSPCGIPAGAAAVSANITVFDIMGAGSNGVLKVGTSAPPPTSWINYPSTETQRANAGILALNGSGQIVVQVNQGAGSVDFLVDVNGYYAPAGTGSFNTFLGVNAGNFTMTGDRNTGFGYDALLSNTTGSANTATGNSALFSNTTGGGNTATGDFSLWVNTSGADNTATGSGALFSNTTGILNTATGASALFSNTTGSGNTATGPDALSSNATGTFNTATGQGSLANNNAGSNNTAIGVGALLNTNGDGNIGIGRDGGINLTTGSNNICIGNAGVAGESSTIRVGSSQTKAFVAGVNGVTTGGTGNPVLIDSNGQLGTVSSSARVKDDIQDMGEATERLLKLRPVTFRNKAQPEGRTQFGLIAEEVEKVMPELVVCSSSGEVETVLYHEMPAMLLNELQKQQREIQEQQGQIDELQKQQRQVEELKSELSALRAVIGQK